VGNKDANGALLIDNKTTKPNNNNKKYNKNQDNIQFNPKKHKGKTKA
jgi:hypothetical protein